MNKMGLKWVIGAGMMATTALLAQALMRRRMASTADWVKKCERAVEELENRVRVRGF